MHVVTVNDYLAKRDAEWMGRVHRFLGLSVGAILSGGQPAHRREVYACDITYGTNNEFGFDYLRDNMAWSKADLRAARPPLRDRRRGRLDPHRRGPHPLIISGPAETSAKWYGEFARLMPLMKKDRHYEVEEAKRTVAVTEEGVEFVEDQLGIENLYEAANTPLIDCYLNNALKAKELFHRDQQYIVSNGEVLIIDEFTGRVLAGRRYNEGMHQAIEAKEKVKIKDENQTLATITLQNYFRLYEKLSGMTGTAQTEAAELHQTYKLGVDPDELADGARGPLRRHLQDGEGQVRRRRRGHRRAQRGRAAGARRHRRRREVRGPVEFLLARDPARGAEREEPRARADRGGRRAARLGHRGDQHGRPRHRHPARRQPGVHRRRGAGARGLSPSETRRSTRPPGTTPSRRPRTRSRPSTSRSSRPAASTCWAPSGTRAGGSTTSCAAGPGARATQGVGSTCRWATT